MDQMMKLDLLKYWLFHVQFHSDIFIFRILQSPESKNRHLHASRPAWLFQSFNDRAPFKLNDFINYYVCSYQFGLVATLWGTETLEMENCVVFSDITKSKVYFVTGSEKAIFVKPKKI